MLVGVGACFLIVVVVDLCGVVVVVMPMVPLHPFSAFLLICPGDRVPVF